MSVEDIPRRVDVSVCHVTTTGALEDCLALAVLRCDVAALAASLTGMPWVYKDHGFAGGDPSLVLDHRAGHGPRRFENAPVETTLAATLAGHVPHAQLLHDDEVVVPHECVAGLVGELASHVGKVLRVLGSQPLVLAVAPAAPELPTIDLGTRLGPCHRTLVLLALGEDGAGVGQVEMCAVAGGDRVGHTHVEPDHGPGQGSLTLGNWRYQRESLVHPVHLHRGAGEGVGAHAEVDG